MYAIEDDTFRRARSVISALASALSDQKESGVTRPIDLRDLVRQSADDLPEGAEADYLSSVAAELARMFPIEEMFPRKHATRDQKRRANR
jgi:hypothetical protein